MKQDLEQLVIEYKEDPNEQRLEYILQVMEPLIKYWCHSQCYLAWEKEDLVQVGRIAVYGALKRFDPSKGIRFKTFAYRTVSGKIMNYYRDSTWRLSIPRKYRELSTYITKAENEYYKEYGENPSADQIADILGMDNKEITQAMEAKKSAQMASLSPTQETGDNSSSFLDFLGQEDGNLNSVEMKKDLSEAMEQLDEQQKKVIYYRFFEDMTQSKIAQLLEISQMQVSRLEKAALEKIRKKMRIDS